MTKGIEYETSVLSMIVEESPSAVVLTGEDRETRERLTKEAMTAGADLIIGGRPPTDLHGRRVGDPDPLIKATPTGYRAVDMENVEDGVYLWGALVTDRSGKLTGDTGTARSPTGPP